VRFKSDDEEIIGSFVNIRITSASHLSLEGELLSASEVVRG
jgi:tRNA A37 methylthiotransferase MiaB